MEVRYVEWIDSSGGSGWVATSELSDYKPLRCTSVGFVVADDDDRLVLVQSFDSQEDGDQKSDHFIAIPKFAITKSKTLRKA